MKVAYWTEESACTQFSTPFLIIFQHRWKGKNTDLFVSWETMRAFETWKPKKRELGWTMVGEQSLHSFCCFCLIANQKLLSVVLLTTSFLSNMLFLTSSTSRIIITAEHLHGTQRWLMSAIHHINNNWLFVHFMGLLTWTKNKYKS